MTTSNNKNVNSSTNPFDEVSDDATSNNKNVNSSTNPFDEVSDDASNNKNVNSSTNPFDEVSDGVTSNSKNVNRSTNPFKEVSDDDLSQSSSASCDDDDEHLSNILKSMDIDADYNCWTSFRSSVLIKSSTKNNPTKNEDDGVIEESSTASSSVVAELSEREKDYIAQWTARVERNEVYRVDYRPVPRETREIEDLASFLGLVPSSSTSSSSRSLLPFGRWLTRSVSDPVADVLLFPSSLSSSSSSASPDDNNKNVGTKLPRSILLKRGPVLLHKKSQEKTKDNGDDDDDDDDDDDKVGIERELILLTHGFIIAVAINPPTSEDDNDTREKSPQRKISPFAIGGIGAGGKKKKKNVIHRAFESAEMANDIISVGHVRDDDSSFTIRLRRRQPGAGGDDDNDDDDDPTQYWFTCAKPAQVEAWMHALMRVREGDTCANPTWNCGQGGGMHVRSASSGTAADMDSIEASRDVAARRAKVSADNLAAARQKRNTNNENRAAAQAAAAAAGTTTTKTMMEMEERGERLERIGAKSSDLRNCAHDYGDMAKRLKEKAKKKDSIFGFRF